VVVNKMFCGNSGDRVPPES